GAFGVQQQQGGGDGNVRRDQRQRSVEQPACGSAGHSAGDARAGCLEVDLAQRQGVAVGRNAGGEEGAVAIERCFPGDGAGETGIGGAAVKAQGGVAQGAVDEPAFGDGADQGKVDDGFFATGGAHDPYST